MVKRLREDSDNTSTADSDDLLGSIDSHHLEPTSSIEASVAGNSKLLHIDAESGEALAAAEVMRCSLPPHARQSISFSSFEDYEVHYNKTHVNRCAECRKNFPTPHFLDLHISENHNPLVDVLKDRGERTFACFVEDCDRKCSTPQKRRMHLIDKHMFPKDYDFYLVNDGIDRRSSMLRTGKHRRRSSAAQHKVNIEDRARRRASTLSSAPEETKVEELPVLPQGEDQLRSGNLEPGAAVTPSTSTTDMDVDSLTGAMSSLRFVPASVKFGRGRGRVGFSTS